MAKTVIKQTLLICELLYFQSLGGDMLQCWTQYYHLLAIAEVGWW